MRKLAVVAFVSVVAGLTLAVVVAVLTVGESGDLVHSVMAPVVQPLAEEQLALMRLHADAPRRSQ